MSDLNIKVSDIKNIDIAIKGIEHYKFKESFPVKIHNEYKDDDDFIIGYNLAKRINSRDKSKRSKRKVV